MFWLIGVKSTSGEAGSKYFQALQAAACDRAGVAAPQLSAEACAIYEAHGDLLRRWVTVQYELTAELLAGIDEVVLHRATSSTASSVQVPQIRVSGRWPPSRPTTPRLRASPSVPNSAVAAPPLVYSAIVPVERILTTPVIGAANPLECEVVLMTGNLDDLTTITWM